MTGFRRTARLCVHALFGRGFFGAASGVVVTGVLPAFDALKRMSLRSEAGASRAVIIGVRPWVFLLGAESIAFR
jgi:hypothetical protein